MLQSLKLKGIKNGVTYTKSKVSYDIPKLPRQDIKKV
jgi:hypothetical protein